MIFMLQYILLQASLKWPSMCTPPQLTFPLTQVMNTSIQEVFVENPASVPVVAQILLLHHYPATQHLLSIIHHQSVHFSFTSYSAKKICSVIL